VPRLRMCGALLPWWLPHMASCYSIFVVLSFWDCKKLKNGARWCVDLGGRRINKKKIWGTAGGSCMVIQKVLWQPWVDWHQAQVNGTANTAVWD
jgi:hypothetical protein